jgi:hypothetical protein
VDEFYVGIEGATVHVEKNGDSFENMDTDEQGVAFWDNVHKEVDETTVYDVWATHDDYVFDGEYGSYTVTCKYLQFVVLPTHMEEQTLEWVFVTDQDDEPADCTVWFMDLPYRTWSDGWVQIYAQDVTAENVFENPYIPEDIVATKSGYESAYDVINVEDTDNINTTLSCEVMQRWTNPEIPIEHAHVEVRYQKYPFDCYTNANGLCEIIFLPETKLPLKYSVRASKWGYFPHTIRRRIFAGQPETFNFKLIKVLDVRPVLELETTSAEYDEELRTHTIEFEATPSQAGEYTFYWDFGDDTFDEEDEGINSHVYSSGEYIISVTAIRDSDSREEYGQMTLTIDED